MHFKWIFTYNFLTKSSDFKILNCITHVCSCSYVSRFLELSRNILPPYHQAHIWEQPLPLRLAMRHMYWCWLTSEYVPPNLQASYNHWSHHCLTSDPTPWPLSCPEIESMIIRHSTSWCITESLVRQLVEDRQIFRQYGLLPGWSLPYLS